MNEFNYNPDEFWHDKPSRRYKGGSGGNDPPSQRMPQTDLTRWTKDAVYPMVANAIKGQGFGTGGFQSQREQSFTSGLGESYNRAKSDFDSNMARTINPTDTRVRAYADNLMKRSNITAQDDMRRTIRSEKVADQTMGMDMAQQYLSNEQRIGVGDARAYNNALSVSMANAQQMGTFGTNVASGMGQGMADYMFAQKMGGS